MNDAAVLDELGKFESRLHDILVATPKRYIVGPILNRAPLIELRKLVNEITDLLEDEIPKKNYHQQITSIYRRADDTSVGVEREDIEEILAVLNAAQARLRRIVRARSGAAALKFVGNAKSNEFNEPGTFDGSALDSATLDVSSERPESAGELHQKLLGRVAVLEAALMHYREAPPGIGHNRAPTDTPEDIGPVSEAELNEVQQLIELLKEQPSNPTALPAEIIARTERVHLVGKKLAEYGDQFATEMFKSAGKEAGKRLVQSPFWLSLSAAIYGVSAVVGPWLSAIAAN